MEFFYDIIVTKTTYLRTIGQNIINLMLMVNLEDTNDFEFLYYTKLYLIIAFYRAIKSNDFLNYIDDYSFSEEGIKNLFNYDLVTTKLNIFKDVPCIPKKKCYIEALFEIMLFFLVNSKKEIYYNLFRDMFITNMKLFAKANTESKTVLFYIDEIKGKEEKNNKALKIFPKHKI